MLTATTSKAGPPSLRWRAASAGISLRHGTHQVAHRLRSTTRSFHSASVLAPPLASLKANVGRWSGSVATLTAATSPRASGAMRLAVASAWPQAASAALPCKPAIPYTAAKLSTAAAARAAINAGRAYLRRRGAAASVSGLWSVLVMIEQTVDV